MPPEQVATYGVPQCSQTPCVQTVLLKQALFAQHGSPSLPHAAQPPPAWHWLPFAQVWPTPMQVPPAPTSQQPLEQRPLAQHGWALPPHAMHWPLRQAAPDAVQVSPGQHGWLTPPHAAHPLAAHVVPDCVQVSPSQQGSPWVPQAAQLPPEQTCPGAVHEFTQQACPAPPQPPSGPPQLPLVHCCPPTDDGHGLPLAKQVGADPGGLLTQQPPPPQVLAAQHRLPLDPQALQIPGKAPLQIVLESVQTRPGQQSPPRPPHTRHVPATQTAPVCVQAPFPQQGCPPLPQEAQFPATQTEVVRVQVLPGQHV